MRTILILCVAIAGALTVGTPIPPSALTGTWRLAGAVATNADGLVDTVFYGPRPLGYLTYTAGGYMQVIISVRDRPRLHGDWRSAPAEATIILGRLDSQRSAKRTLSLKGLRRCCAPFS